MSTQPIPVRQTAREATAAFLRREIVTGSLPPGTRLNVVDIAAQLGVSPTPAREAIHLLAGESLVQLDAYRGAHVSELSPDEYEEICAMRIGLEGLAARVGAEAIDDDGIERMRAAHHAMEQAAERNDIDAFMDADRTFHQVHYSASGRDSLWQRVIGLRYAAERYTRAAYELPGVDTQNTLHTHSVLLEAVAAHEAASAQELMENDLRTTATAMIEQLRLQAEPAVPASLD